MHHFYSTCVLALDENVKPHVLLTPYLPRPPETMRDISARGSQHVDEEFVGWGWYLARSISPLGHGTDHLVKFLWFLKK